MKGFVNYKKRSVQLPKGYKDLADVLKGHWHPAAGRGSLPASFPNAKCDYCGGRPVGGLRMLGGEAHFWCEQCQRDLNEYYAQSVDVLPEDIGFVDEELVRAVALQVESFESRKEDYMRRKVMERKGAA